MFYRVLNTRLTLTHFFWNITLLIWPKYFYQLQNLEIYVFDDLDKEQASYLGMAAVPLISLSQDKSLKGKFLLKNVGNEAGFLLNVS